MLLDCLVNGELLKLVPATDRGLNYGDGLFETLAVIQGQPRWWQDHMDRLALSCDCLGMQMPAQAVLLREVQTVSAGTQKCAAKIVLTRGAGGRGYAPQAGMEPTRIVSAHEWPSGIENDALQGVEGRTCDIKLGIQPELGGMKHLNRLEQVLASAEMTDHEASEGIMLDTADHVISAIASNLFMVYQQQLMTPRLDRCGVRGVLRGRILKIMKKRCELRRISHDMLAGASEVFLCSSLRGIVPLRKLDNVDYAIGSVTRELQGWLEASVGNR